MSNEKKPAAWIEMIPEADANGDLAEAVLKLSEQILYKMFIKDVNSTT